MARDSPINAHHNISTKTRGNTVPRPFFFFFKSKQHQPKTTSSPLPLCSFKTKLKHNTEKPVGKTCSLTS